MKRVHAVGPEQWQRACSAAYVPLHVRSAPDFQGWIDRAELARLGVSRTWSSPSSVTRTPQGISADPREDVLISLQTVGESVIEHDNIQRRIPAGAAVICEADRPYTLMFRSASENLTLRVPRHQIRLSDAALRGVHGEVVRESGSLLILQHFLNGALEANEVMPHEQEELSDLALGLLSVVLDPVLVQSRSHLRLRDSRSIHAAAAGYLKWKLGDPSLAIESIARRYGVSRRQLDADFVVGTGRTAAAFLRQMRLEHGRELLLREVGTLTVNDIALRVGFNDPTTFIRAFRRAFGETPESLRGRSSSADSP